MAKKETKVNVRHSLPENCVICLGPIEDGSVTNSCSHSFCFPCILQWAKEKQECPLCKNEFDKIFFNDQQVRRTFEGRLIRPRAKAQRYSSESSSSNAMPNQNIELHTLQNNSNVENHQIPPINGSIRPRTRSQWKALESSPKQKKRPYTTPDYANPGGPEFYNGRLVSPLFSTRSFTRSGSSTTSSTLSSNSSNPGPSTSAPESSTSINTNNSVSQSVSNDQECQILKTIETVDISSDDEEDEKRRINTFSNFSLEGECLETICRIQ
ncbi:hypothetical protein CEXT_795371 [Caerostris extrusa]|uniref:RING-type E3 ubiquitin transferase n=1 Tax=Caerostris extrusa TaxID=172846 RepID=A0AAV4RTU1_CAEEX|nr:hypothetical protein CEXT_795371 [Caerostris extrusa]